MRRIYRVCTDTAHVHSTRMILENMEVQDAKSLPTWTAMRNGEEPRIIVSTICSECLDARIDELLDTIGKSTGSQKHTPKTLTRKFTPKEFVKEM